MEQADGSPVLSKSVGQADGSSMLSNSVEQADDVPMLSTLVNQDDCFSVSPVLYETHTQAMVELLLLDTLNNFFFL